MNKKIILTLLPMLLLSTGCSNPSNSTSSSETNSVIIDKAYKNQLIDKLIANVLVEGTMNQKINYGEEYPQLNFDTTENIKRHYVVAKDDNGKEMNTVTIYNDYGSLTYFENKQGLADYEVLDTNNKVVMLPYYHMNKHVRYVDLFENPFTYLDYNDIDKELNLSLDKANFIVNYFFGSEVSVTTAKFVIENEVLKGLDLVIGKKTIFKENYDGSSVYADLETTITLSLNTNYGDLVRLTPNTETFPELETAFAELDANNYTIKIQSMGLDADIMLYNADNAIYLHRDANETEPVHNDYLFVKDANNITYTGYQYSIDDAAFLPVGYEVDKSIILATYSEINTALFDKTSETHYKLDYAAAKFNAELLISDALNSYPGNSYEATVKLSDGHVEYCDIVNGAGVEIQQSFINVGSTKLPTWLDITKI